MWDQRYRFVAGTGPDKKKSHHLVDRCISEIVAPRGQHLPGEEGHHPGALATENRRSTRSSLRWVHGQRRLRGWGGRGGAAAGSPRLGPYGLLIFEADLAARV